ncbi:MAG: branched-chain amino acid ABC transporter permease [Deltaproteobacteria bacterium]|nr:branched-chain amino acid ABC transporter permease [Deltaproteobacteria bacterium]
MFIQQLIGGVSAGFVYALIGLATTLVFKATDTINFAVGEMMMVSAFVAYTLLNVLKLPYYQVIVLTILFSGLLGLFLERLVFRPVMKAPVFTGIMLTFGLALTLRGIAGATWSFDTYTIEPVFSIDPIRLSKVVVTPLTLGNIAVSILLMLLLFSFFKFTVLGVGLRAAAQNRLAAVLMGIKVKRVNSLTWMISSMIGGVASILLAPITYIDTNMGIVAIKAFVACILGGFGSIPGCILGGILLGVMESFAGYYLPTEYKQAFTFLVLIGVLSLKPTGILGIPKMRRV